MDSSLRLVCLSINHRTTPLDVREAIVFEDAEASAFLQEWQRRARLSEAALVSTCNRTELYGLLPAEAHADPFALALELLREMRGFVPSERPRNHELARDEEAVRHLFRVVSGLDSQIVGESQILGQIKESGRRDRESGVSGKKLSRLWEWAIRVGKRVHTETALGEGALSASYAALELARKVFGTLAEKRILVVSAGEIAVLTLENLAGVKTGGITIINRDRPRAEALAARHQGAVRDFDELEAVMAESDLVISSTASPECIVSYRSMKRIRARRRGDHPLLVIDLAVPRDFDERAGTIDGVFLKNLDDLEEITELSMAQRRSELPRAEAIVEDETQNYVSWLHAQVIEPVILSLRERFERIRAEELEKIRAEVDPEVFGRFERLTRRLVNRLLHAPSTNLRRHEGVRDEEIYRVLHEVLTQDIPHPRARGDRGDEEAIS